MLAEISHQEVALKILLSCFSKIVWVITASQVKQLVWTVPTEVTSRFPVEWFITFEMVGDM
jgi:hypothetical protein